MAAAKKPAAKKAGSPVKAVKAASRAPAAKAKRPAARPAAKPALKPAAKPAATSAAKPAVKVAPKAAPVPVKTLASVVAPPLPKAIAKPAAKAAKPEKIKKPKQVRDSFTMPKTEYAVLDVLKLRASTAGNAVKKSELLRAGVKALAAMSDAAFADALKAVPAIKTGRPKLAGN